MGIKEVGVGATSLAVVGPSALFGCDGCQQFAVYLMGFLPVLQSCPEVDTPARTPARRLVAFDLKRPLASLQQSICFSPEFLRPFGSKRQSRARGARGHLGKMISWV